MYAIILTIKKLTMSINILNISLSRENIWVTMAPHSLKIKYDYSGSVRRLLETYYGLNGLEAGLLDTRKQERKATLEKKRLVPILLEYLSNSCN